MTHDAHGERLVERLGHFSRYAAGARRRLDVHHALVRDARDGLDARHALLYIAPPAGEGLRLVSASGALGAASARSRLDRDDDPVVQAYRRCAPAYSTARDASAAHLPILIHGLSVGVLSVALDTGRELTALERAFLEALTALGASALEAVRHRDDAAEPSSAEHALLARVAHELRHPLSVIVMKAATLRRRAGEELRREIDAIDRSASRLDRMIQDAMDVSEIAAGRLRARVSPHAVELAELLRIAHRSCAAPARVTSRLPAQPIELTCDRARVLQVLDHLIGNALKFTPEPGRVTVRADVGEVEVVLHVEDEGRGIASDELARLFEPPRAGRPRPKRPGEGAGLGLFMCRGLVEAHGGRLWAHSAIGHGSCFSFALPRSVAAAAPRRPLIVVAEDDASSRRDLVEVLARAGYLARGVATGRDAQAYLRSHPPPSLVLLDPRLRGVSGAELMAWMRAELASVPVVLVRGTDDRVSRAADGEPAACLERPLAVGELLAVAARFAQPRPA